MTEEGRKGDRQQMLRRDVMRIPIWEEDERRKFGVYVKRIGTPKRESPTRHESR